MTSERTYIAIDLKSFYASVECVARGLDPLATNLVVADKTRTEKTICLAVTPSLKAYGISGRARLFEVIEAVKYINAERLIKAPGRKFKGKSYLAEELANDPSLELDYIIAPPKMQNYIDVSSAIYAIYLRYISPDDIHVYSIDEVFIDATDYLKIYQISAHDLAMKLVHEVLSETGITATAGIGPNLYLCKIAMDIVAKHIPADKDGVRIAELTEKSYRQKLWHHTPITDFWRVGNGYARKLANHGLYSMWDIARCSLGKPSDYHNEDLLYKLFGINAELLIDHAWGFESCTIPDIKNYMPSGHSVSTGQVLKQPYSFEEGRLVIKEMADSLSLDLVRKNLLTNQLVISVGYDISNLLKEYNGNLDVDMYGRHMPAGVHSSINLPEYTSSTRIIVNAADLLYDSIANRNLYVRRLSIAANDVKYPSQLKKASEEQLCMFVDYEKKAQILARKNAQMEEEKNEQIAILKIKEKMGKNAIFKAMDLLPSATTIERNGEIGGHKA